MAGQAAGREHGVVAPVPADPSGQAGPTRRQAAGPGWRRSSRGLYVPAHVTETPEQRVVEVAATFRTSGLAVTGWAALRWRGSRPFEERRREAYVRAARLPIGERRWTVTPPDWWVETHTVDRRRALPPHLARTWHPRYAGWRARSA